MKTAYFTHKDCLGHDMGAGHPECPERLWAIEKMLSDCNQLNNRLLRQEAPLASLEQLQLAHEKSYVLQVCELMQQVAKSGQPRAIDPDTCISPQTWLASLRAVGAAIAATEAVIRGEVANAFCAIRPPGHHATRQASMGFCFFNNVAIAARYALDIKGLQRVAIVDFDVHHGNGTEDILAGDKRVMMVGLFQEALYPFSGVPAVADNMHNVPVVRGSRGADIREHITAAWLPVLDQFKPDMIFVSAGFDAHQAERLAHLNLAEADFIWLTELIKDVANRHSQGRIVSCLEGGYDLPALATSVAAHLQVLTS